MKKLMLAVAAVAIVGSASAVQVYTYKASVKHTYLKIKKVGNQSLYVRYTKNTSLDGYLVQDNQESLSATYAGVGGPGAGTISSVDPQPGNRCFLVAKNKSPEKGYKFAAIIPGVIDAKWYDDKLAGGAAAKPVQAYLYLGGQTVNAYVGTTFVAADANLVGYNANPRAFANWSRRTPAGVPAPTFGIDDYWFTSTYLFGQYNQPSWSPLGGIQEFGDTWMNHAGFGKMLDDSDACCGDTSGGRQMDSLSGSVKVGIWLCTESGDDKNHADPNGVVRRGVLEDQLWKGVVVNDPIKAWPGTTYNIGVNGDAVRILDMWGDGNLDLGTTDVGYGTFSLKRTTKRPFDVVSNMQALDPADDVATIVGWGYAAPAGERLVLCRALKTALVLLKTDSSFLGDATSKSANALINASFYAAYLQ